MLLGLMLALLVLLLVLALLIQTSGIAGFGVRFLVHFDQVGAASSPRAARTTAVRVMMVIAVGVMVVVIVLHPIARLRHLQHALRSTDLATLQSIQ